MRYEHTQIGYVPIYALLAPAVLFAVEAISHHSRDLLVISAIFLVTIALFYKLTIEIDGPTLLASFGIGLIKKKVLLAEIVRCEPIRIRWWYGWGDSPNAERLAL